MENLVIGILFFCVRSTTYLCNGAQHIDVPPVITSEFDPEYFVPIFHSTPLSLFCQANNTVVTYQWYKDYSEIVENDRVSFNRSTGEIVFINLKEEDFGDYYCLAKNKFGTSVSLFVKLLKAVLVDQSSSTSNVEQTCKEYHRCNLTCYNQPRCQPRSKCMVEWKVGYGTSKSVMYNTSVTLDREGNLHFLNISTFDGEKNYSCGTWNEKIKVFKKSSITNIHVNDSLEDVVSPEAIYQSGDKVFLGENATLLCIFSGNPVPEVIWQRKNGTNITINDKYVVGQYGRQLRIVNVSLDDEGVYKCIANRNLTQTPFLNVTSPPLFPDVGRHFMTKIVQISKKVTTIFLCNAMSISAEIEPVVIKWMKNGKIFDEDVRYQLSNDKKTFHIYNTSSDDAGCYTCLIGNSEGIAVAIFFVHFAKTDNHQSYHILETVLIALFSFAGILLLSAAAIIIRKRICIDMKDREFTARLQIARTNNIYSDSDDYIGPNIDEAEYTYIENTHTDSDSVKVVRQNQYEDAYAENDYNILGESSTTPSNYAEANHYDFSENISGIYTSTCRGRVVNTESYD